MKYAIYRVIILQLSRSLYFSNAIVSKTVHFRDNVTIHRVSKKVAHHTLCNILVQSWPIAKISTATESEIICEHNAEVLLPGELTCIKLAIVRAQKLHIFWSLIIFLPVCCLIINYYYYWLLIALENNSVYYISMTSRDSERSILVTPYLEIGW